MKLWLPLVLLGSLVASPALGQSETSKQGEDLAKSMREASATTVLQSGYENGVPGYGGTDIDASKYLNDDEALTDAGVNARYSDPNYSVVIDPTRPEFDPSTIDLSAAKTIESTPESFLGQGLGAGGSTSSCEPLPTDGVASSTYYETCNQGDQLFQQQQSCTSSLNVRFDRVTTWVYYATTNGPFVHKGGFAAPVASGVCKSKGIFGYCTESRARGFSPTKGCRESDYAAEIFECTAEPSGLGPATPGTFPGTDPHTRQYWSSKGETVSPPIVTRTAVACSYGRGQPTELANL